MKRSIQWPPLTWDYPKWPLKGANSESKPIILAWSTLFYADDWMFIRLIRVSVVLVKVWNGQNGWIARLRHDTQPYSELITSWISRTRFLTSLNRDTYQNIIMKDAPFVKLLNRTPWTCNSLKMQLQIGTDQCGPVNVNLSVRSPDCGQFKNHFFYVIQWIPMNIFKI